jgi:GNAT superfamily N-acetyltransferase
MRAREEGTIRVRALRATELGEASGIAAEAFREDAFYQRALGLDARAFDVYWRLFLPMACADPGARVFALEVSGRLAGLLVAGLEAFPRPGRALRFVAGLGRRIGLIRLVRYLRFVAAYESAMRRPPEERVVEARGLWLLVARRSTSAGLAPLLLRAAIEELSGEGKSLFTGLMDAGQPALARLYRRAGFAVSPSFPFRGGSASKIELRALPAARRTAC